MSKNKLILVALAMLGATVSMGQTMKLEAIIDSITKLHPVVKMYDNEIRSMDEAAKGAKSWMPPEFTPGYGWFPIIRLSGKRMIWVNRHGTIHDWRPADVTEQKETKC